jgi:glycosyltransferase involved in cell wall biosynthesis
MRCLQIFRTPVGGLFRHVRDLARSLAGLGHEVGVICDSTTGGSAAEEALRALEPSCSLGIHRLPIGRLPGLADISAASAIARLASSLKPEVLHGHGAKGGVYARLAGSRLEVPALYTPHGGSLHYEWASPRGALFLTAERLLLSKGAGLLFVCDYERATFERKIGLAGLPYRVVPNGLWPEEFVNVPLSAGARDLVFLGEMRELKGVGDLLGALASLKPWRQLTATLVGDGTDRARFEAQAQRLGLAGDVHFAGALPARKAFGLGRLMVMPSRAESLPYVILEAVAAGKPLIATRVGGIPEIIAPEKLVPPASPEALGQAIRNRLEGWTASETEAQAAAQAAQSRFSAEVMGQAIAAFYQDIKDRGHVMSPR